MPPDQCHIHRHIFVVGQQQITDAQGEVVFLIIIFNADLKRYRIFLFDMEDGIFIIAHMLNPMANITVRTILEKGTAPVNEDCLVARDNIFGVFDGATSLDKRTFGQGRTGGRLAAEAAMSVFRCNHFPLYELAGQANDEIMDQMKRHGVDISRKENLWSTSAAVVRINGNSLEWVQAGDAMILVIYHDGSHNVLAERHNHDYKTLCLWRNLIRDQPGAEKDTWSGSDLAETRAKVSLAREKLAGQIRRVRSQMNVTYGVLNGEKAAKGFLSHGTRSLAHVRHILLFTDGLTIPSPVPDQKKDYSALVDRFLALGLNGLKTSIRRTEETDPFCLVFPRFKCHDDIACIAIRFN